MEEHTLFDLENVEIKGSERPEIILANAPKFKELIMQYECAIMEVSTKLNVLNNEFSHLHQRNPIETIKTRIKSTSSIIEKIHRKDLPQTWETLENRITDIAGIRVICPFPDDIYIVAKLLAEQDDIVVVEEKDYIKNPKPNGYRSLHLIIQIPIFLASGKKNMNVEVQLRTIAMDFWASLDHKMRYKKDLSNSEEIATELRECADIITGMDLKMQNIRKKIQ